MAFSSDGRRGLSGSADKTARLWDLATGKELRSFLGHTDEVLHVAFSQDGKQVFTNGKDQTVRLWDVATGKEVRIL